jgi:dTDP-glucose 4,6-dehydratase
VTRVVVSGGAGFIGSAVCHALVARGAFDAPKARRELGWKPQRHFEAGLAQTVQWYLDNRSWWEPLRTRVYGGDRLGLLEPAQ